MATKESLTQSLINEGVLKTPRIIEAFRAINRADFVPKELKDEAYGNYPLPIGDGQTISQPLTVAFMLELLDPKPGEKILDVGFGSGWTTALLSFIVAKNDGGKVFAIEYIPELCEIGKQNMAAYHFVKQGVAVMICSDGKQGLREQAPFDKILSGASAQKESIPPAWREQLGVGGRIVAPIGSSIWLLIKKSRTSWKEREFPGFAFVPLR